MVVDMVTRAELRRFLAENLPVGAFTPYCHLSDQSGALTVYFEGEPDYSEQLTDEITLYRALDDNRVIGCRIEGIPHLAKADDSAAWHALSRAARERRWQEEPWGS